MDTKQEIQKLAKSLMAFRTPMQQKIASIIQKSAILNERTGGYTVLKGAMTKDLIAFYRSLDEHKQKEFLRVLEYITPWDYVGGISNGDSDKIADITENVIKTLTGNKNFRMGSVRTAGRWVDVKAMRKDLGAMLDQFEEWLEKEKAAVADGSARFDNRSYYQAAFDAIEEADEKMKKVERYL